MALQPHAKLIDNTDSSPGYQRGRLLHNKTYNLAPSITRYTPAHGLLAHAIDKVDACITCMDCLALAHVLDRVDFCKYIYTCEYIYMTN